MNLKTFLAAITIVMCAVSAEAISLRYKFKVFSSGPNIYACNAGILAQQSEKKVCYFQGTNMACTPTDCSTTAGTCDSSCICSGSNGGDYLMNYGRVTYQDWKDNGDISVTNLVKDKVFSSTTTNAWAQALTDAEGFDKRITDLSFNLGSELYSARYFVDICYRGPQIEYWEDHVNASFNLINQAYATDFLATGVNLGENNRDGLQIPATVDGRKYTELAGLKVQSFVVCDLQGQGVLKYARNTNNEYNTSQNEATFTFGSNKNPNGAAEGSTAFWQSSEKGVSASLADLVNSWVTLQASKTPRFCKVRYVFSETDYANALPNLRKWQRHGAEMCTYTEITEGVVQ